MAEIKVEKREKTPIWPWIIGILLLIAVAWFLYDALGENGEREYQERQEEAESEEVGDASLFLPEMYRESAHSINFLHA